MGKRNKLDSSKYVDRKTCNICHGGLPALLKRIGVEELTIFSGGSKTPVIIKAIE